MKNSIRNYFAMNPGHFRKCPNTYPNNQLCSEKWGGHFTSFVAILHSLHSITNKKKFFAINPSCFGNAGKNDKASWKPYHATTNWHLALSVKKIGGQRCVSPWYVHSTYCSWWKSIFQAKATSNSGKIKLIALFTVELCLAEGVRRESVSIKFCKIKNLLEGFGITLKAWRSLLLSYYKRRFGLVLRWYYWLQKPSSLWSLI